MLFKHGSPKNVYTKVESFLVDIPRSNDEGNEWNYDITVEPKNVTIYANVYLTVKTTDNTLLGGVGFNLKKKIDGTWTDYEL